MSFFTKLFGGSSVKTMPQDTALEGQISDLANYDPGLGFYGKWAKSTLKRIGRGDDVSSYGDFNVLRQNQAAEERSIGEDYMKGQNALISQAGGEQANLLQRAKEIALEKARERHGMQMVGALTNLQQTAGGAYEGARGQRINAELGAKQSALSGRLGYYGQRYRLVQDPGMLNTLANVAGGAGAAMAI